MILGFIIGVIVTALIAIAVLWRWLYKAMDWW